MQRSRLMTAIESSVINFVVITAVVRLNIVLDGKNAFSNVNEITIQAGNGSRKLRDLNRSETASRAARSSPTAYA